MFASKSDWSSTVRDAKSGIMKNSPIPISSPNVIINPVPTLPSSAPSSPDLDESCSFEAMVYARLPITNVSVSTNTPRMNGMRRNTPAVQLRSGMLCTLTVPSSRRTASAQRSGPRIITPSITAWPP